MQIARRELEVISEGNKVTMEIRLFKPEPDDNAWSCRYEIDWPTGTKKMNAFGVDSVQAILLATQMIGAELYASQYHKNGQLAWSAAKSGYGFPVTSSIRDLLVGEDRDM